MFYGRDYMLKWNLCIRSSQRSRDYSHECQGFNALVFIEAETYARMDLALEPHKLALNAI